MEELPTKEEIEAHRKNTEFVAPTYEDFEKHLEQAVDNTKKGKLVKKAITPTQEKFFAKYFGKEPHVHSKDCDHSQDFPFKTPEDLAKETFETFVQAELNPMARNPPEVVDHARRKAKGRTYLLDKGTNIHMKDAVASLKPSLVQHTFKKITSALLPYEREWLIDLKFYRDKVSDPDTIFLLDFFDAEDLKKMIKGQTLSKQRLIEIQDEVVKREQKQGSEEMMSK